MKVDLVGEIVEGSDFDLLCEADEIIASVKSLRSKLILLEICERFERLAFPAGGSEA